MRRTLKPCPFCGGRPVGFYEDGKAPRAVMRCPKCGAVTDEMGSPLEARRAWQSRMLRTPRGAPCEGAWVWSEDALPPSLKDTERG